MAELDAGWLRTAELARLWPIPESTWRYWRHRGFGPPSVKVGRHVLYRQVDVEAWLSELQLRQAQIVRNSSGPGPKVAL